MADQNVEKFSEATEMLRRRRDFWSRHAPLLITSLCLIGFHISFKATVPAAHHNDFRMVQLLLVPMATAFVLSTESVARREALLAWPLRLLGGALVLLSMLYFWPKYDFVRRHFSTVLQRHEGELRAPPPRRAGAARAHGVSFLGDELVVVTLEPARDVAELETSLGVDDRYTVELLGADETRAIELVAEPSSSPRRREHATHRRTLTPPVRAVRALRVRPEHGDYAFSLGHVTVR